MRVGVMLPMGSNESGGVANLVALARHAEDEGLDSVWAADHLFYRGDQGLEGLHEVWTVLTAVAAATTRVTLGPLVLAVPFRNPVLTAKMAAELDALSGGRLVLGLGCGWHEPEFEAMGIPFDHRVGRFEEALRILVRLLRGETVTSEGRWHRANGAVLVPAPMTPGGPPILIAGRQPRMLHLVAEHASQWNGAWFGEPTDADRLREQLDALRGALVATGRDPASLALTAGIEVAFDDAAEDVGPRAIRGPTEHIADALAGYAALGISEVITQVFPRTPQALTRYAEAVHLARTRLAAEGDGALVVRRATAADARVLHEVAAATFALACPPGTAEADIEAFISDQLSEARFTGYLADPGRILFLATLDGLAVGYTMLVTGEPGDADAAAAVTTRPTLELSKIYVRPEWHRLGVADRLMETSLAAAAASGARSVWLGVNQRNERANRFYERQGFGRVGTKRFRVGTEWHDDFVRERRLDAAVDPLIAAETATS